MSRGECVCPKCGSSIPRRIVAFAKQEDKKKKEFEDGVDYDDLPRIPFSMVAQMILFIKGWKGTQLRIKTSQKSRCLLVISPALLLDLGDRLCEGVFRIVSSGRGCLLGGRKKRRAVESQKATGPGW